MSERPREFIPVDDEKEAISLLREGAKTVSSALIWTRDQTHVLKSHLSLYSEADKVIYAWVPKDLDLAKFIDEVIKLSIKDFFFSVSLARANLFFKAEFLGNDPGGLRFRVPEKLYKVQRRKDLRFTIPEGHVLKVDHQDPLVPGRVFTRKVLNLSASGMAVLLPPEEANNFTAGAMLPGVSFTLRSRVIGCEAEVRHIMPLAESHRLAPGSQMGVLFHKIKPGDADWIASYVFEESRKFYTRFL